MDILQQFGVKPILLAGQIVNFLVLLYLLKRFLYKPLLKVLDERKKVIADSLKNADEIEVRLNKITEEREKRLNEASKEGKAIIEESTKAATVIIAEAHEKASLDVKKMLEKAEGVMKLEKDRLHDEIRNELSQLIISGLQKVTGKVLSEKDQKELIERSVKDLKV